jgi:hypothetical protein
MFRFVPLVVLAALGVLALVPAGLAGQPVTQTLNPPPPSYETCKAIGSGTICEGTRPDAYGPVDTGIVCGTGAQAFDIFDQGAANTRATRYYDSDGNLTRRVRHDEYTFGQFSNPLLNASVSYTQTDTTTDVLAVPGDLGSATETNTGQNIYHPGGGGAPVFLNAGKTVVAPDGTLDFRAGPQNFLDYFVDGDAAVIDQLCAALGAA